MKSRTYTYISRLISRLPREFMLQFLNSDSTSASHTSHHRKHPNATYTQPQTAKGKANENLYARPSHRAAAAACLSPQRLARRNMAVHHCTSCVVPGSVSSSARTFCSPSPPVWIVPQLAAAALLPRRRRTAPAFPRSRRAAPAPLSCCSRAAIVSVRVRAACPQTRAPRACMAASVRGEWQRDNAAEAEAGTHRETPVGRRVRVHATRSASGPARLC